MPKNDPAKEEKNINTDYHYHQHLIVKVWDANLKKKNIAYYVTNEEKAEVIPTLFSGLENMSLDKAGGILVTHPKKPKLYKNPANQSVSICTEVDFTEVYDAEAGVNHVTYHLEKTLKAIETWQEEETEKIHQHIIVFPFHANADHWNLGVLKLEFNKETHQLHTANLIAYEPLYPNVNLDKKLVESVRLSLANIFKKEQLILDSELRYTAQQQDGSSCGAISAENGMEIIIQGKLTNKVYETGAPKLRKKHVDEVNNPRFTQMQKDNEIINPGKPTVHIKQNEVTEKFQEFIKWLSGDEQQIVTNFFEKLLKDAALTADFEKLKTLLNDRKNDLQKLKVGNESLYSIFFVGPNKWQGNVCDILHNIAANISKTHAPSPPSQNLDFYDKRYNLVKAFPGPLYQCLLALNYMLELLGKGKNFRIRMEDEHAGAFDDIIIEVDDQIIHVQIKHKYDEDFEFNIGAIRNKSGAIDLPQYFDDWWIFIRTDKQPQNPKKSKTIIFQTNGKFKKDLRNVLEQKDDFFQFTEKFLKGIKKETAIIKRIEGPQIYVVPEKPADLSFYLGNYIVAKDTGKIFYIKHDKKKKIIANPVETNITCAEVQELIENNEPFEADKPLSESDYAKVTFAFWNTIKKFEHAEESSVVLNPVLALRAHHTKISQNPAYGSMVKLVNEEDFEGLVEPESRQAINQFMTALKFKFDTPDLETLTKMVKDKIAAYFEKQVTSDAVFYALIAEVHRWLISMREKPWDNATVKKHLDDFGNIFLRLNEQIGGTNLLINQTQYLPYLKIIRLQLSAEITKLAALIKQLAASKVEDLLWITTDSAGDGSLLVTEYLQSAHNNHVLGEYLFVDGRFLDDKFIKAVSRKEVKLIIINNIEDNKSAVVKFFEILNQLRGLGKKIILIVPPALKAKLKREPTKELEFPVSPLDQKQIKDIIDKAGKSNDPVTIGPKTFKISEIISQGNARFCNSVASLSVLLGVLDTVLPPLVVQESEKNFVPLTIEEEVSLFNFAQILQDSKPIILYAQDNAQETIISAALKTERIILDIEIPFDNLANPRIIDVIVKEKNREASEDPDPKKYVVVVNAKTNPKIVEAQYEHLTSKFKIIYIVHKLPITSVPLLRLIDKKRYPESSSLLDATLEPVNQSAYNLTVQEPTVAKRILSEDSSDLFNISANANNISIIAEAGSGKSTTSRRLYESWLNSSSQSSTVTAPLFVIHVELKRLKPQWQNLIDIIRDTYELSADSWQMVVLQESLENRQIIFVLDGLDELKIIRRQQCKSLIDQLVAYGRVIWTMRPTELAAAPFKPERKFKLQPFNDPKKRDYLQKRFGKSPDFVNEAVKFLKRIDNKDVFEMIGSPLLCALLCDSWQLYYEAYLKGDKEATPWLTQKSMHKIQLFQGFIFTKLQKFLNVHMGVKQVTKMLQEERTYLFCFRYLADLQENAFQQFFEQEPQRKYEGWLHDDISEMAIVDIPSMGIGKPKLGAPITYKFSHQTIIEYFAAIYFVRLLNSDPPKASLLIKEHRYHPRYWLFWEFVMSILCYKDSSLSDLQALPEPQKLLQEFMAEPRDRIGKVEMDILARLVRTATVDLQRSLSPQLPFNALSLGEDNPNKPENKMDDDEESESKNEKKEPFLKFKKPSKLQPEIKFVTPTLPHEYHLRGDTIRHVANNNYSPGDRIRLMKWLCSLSYSESYRVAEAVIDALLKFEMRDQMVIDALRQINRIHSHKFGGRVKAAFARAMINFGYANTKEIVPTLFTGSQTELFFYFKEIPAIFLEVEQIQQLLEILEENSSVTPCFHLLIFYNFNFKSIEDFSDSKQKLLTLLKENYDISIKIAACLILIKLHEPLHDTLINLLCLDTDLILSLQDIIDAYLGLANETTKRNMLEQLCELALAKINDGKKDDLWPLLILIDKYNGMNEELMRGILHPPKGGNFWYADVTENVLERLVNYYGEEITSFLNEKCSEHFKKGKHYFADTLFNFLRKMLTHIHSQNRPKLIAAFINLYGYLHTSHKATLFEQLQRDDEIEVLNIAITIFSNSAEDQQKVCVQFIYDFCCHFKLAITLEDDGILIHATETSSPIPLEPVVSEALCTYLAIHHTMSPPLALMPPQKDAEKEEDESSESVPMEDEQEEAASLSASLEAISGTTRGGYAGFFNRHRSQQSSSRNLGSNQPSQDKGSPPVPR